MRRAGISDEERDAFYAEATSGDYYHLLATCTRWSTWRRGRNDSMMHTPPNTRKLTTNTAGHDGTETHGTTTSV